MRFVHFADDTTVFASDNDINIVHATVNRELVGADNWLKANRLSLNIGKPSYMIISNQKNATEFEIQFLQKSQLSNSLALHLMKSSVHLMMHPNLSNFFNYIGIYFSLSSSPNYFRIFSCPISHATLWA